LIKLWKDRDQGGEALFALPSAHISLETKLGLKSSKRASICFKEVSGMSFSQLVEDTKRFLDFSKEEFGVSYYVTKDNYGYLWFVLRADRIEDLVTAINAIGESVADGGFDSQLLASVFEFQNEIDSNQKLYLIYNYKHKSFYPFVPSRNKSRNTEVELRVYAQMKEEIPMLKDMQLWYPLWEMPLQN
jgi:hypothetical protein